jgi:uroporphyrinogen decarboxylase
MNSRERIFAALEHRNPDRVPYDLAGTHVSGIHQIAYQNLCRYLKLDDSPAPFADIIQQVVIPSDAVLKRLQVDTRGLFPLCSHNWNVRGEDKGNYFEYCDEWNFVHQFHKGGYWWSLVKSPLDGFTVDAEQLQNYSWPPATLPERITGLRKQAEKFRAEGKIVMLKGLCAGLLEMGQRLRGMENFLCDLLVDPGNAERILDKLTEHKIQFWEMALEELGDVVDIAVESDDYGTQESQLVPPDTFRKLFKPRYKEIFSVIKKKFTAKKPDGEHGWIFFHSCGNVRPILPDFIEIGVDILNPVHVNAAGMEPIQLKKDFGSEVTFWGGGVETQNILPRGTPEEVREDVKRNLDALMPGGGFVFNTVHNIQAEVPPENIMAMWETLQEYGKY